MDAVFSMRLILHGRRICKAAHAARCAECDLLSDCPQVKRQEGGSEERLAMADLILAIDQGTTGTTVFVIECARHDSADGPIARFGSSIRNPDGWSMTPRKSIDRRSRLAKEAIRKGASAANRKYCRDRDHQSARDVCGMGAAHRPVPSIARYRLAMARRQR